jgi:hypothetical protein
MNLPELSIKSLNDIGLLHVVPCEPKSKVCSQAGWTTNSSQIESFSPDANIGVVMGSDFADVDLDCPEANQVADILLPKTACVFGRASTPRAHRIYRVAGAKHATYADPEHDGAGKAMIVELRTGPHQTLAPGSIHPSGEAIEFAEYGPPSVADASELAQRVVCVAFVVLVLRSIWTKGSHHGPSLGLAGCLAKAGISEEIARDCMRALATFSPKADLKQLLANVRTTYARYATGEPIAGITALRDAGMGQARLDRLAKWLGLDHGDAKPSPSAQPSNDGPDYAACLTTCGAFRKRSIPPKKAVIDGVLMSSDVALIYGAPGSGKSLVALSMASAIASGKAFAGHDVLKKQKVLFVDGELGGSDLKALIEAMDVHDDVKLIASIDLDQRGVEANIANPSQQDSLVQLITANQVEVVVFDNLFSLAMIAEFVSNDDPGIVSLGKFGTRLRNMGVTVVLIHHGTKTGTGPAGATRLTVHNDLTIKVSKSDDQIELVFEKTRGRRKPEPVLMKLIDEGGELRLEEDFAMPPGQVALDREMNVLSALSEAPQSLRKLAQLVDLSKSVVGEVVKGLIAKGHAGRKGSNGPAFITDEGQAYLEKFNI